ncbi:putative GTP-binding protein 6 [Pyxicephalus adspersus]|uniref:putative GTP-binding protein 6 n=1 Tax=Pyxicephalus adspersus TaxID=30357 RepID=UPI003B5C83D5
MFIRGLLRLVRAGHTVRGLSVAPRYPSLVLPFLGCARLQGLGFRTLWSSPPCRNAGSWDGGDNGEWSSDEEDEELEELLVSESAALQGAHNVLIIHPDVKWGIKKPRDTTAELLIAEAEALILSIPEWIVVEKLIISTKAPDKKCIFGKGNIQALTEKIKRTPHITAVFLNVERLSALSEVMLDFMKLLITKPKTSDTFYIFLCCAVFICY